MKSAAAVVCLLALCLFFPSCTVAQAPATSTPDLSKYATEPYVVEKLHKTYRFEADGKGQREAIVRIRVQSESAVREFGLLVYPYMASFENLDILYARVRKPDGSVVDTPAEEIQELDSAVSREAPMYTDQREKHIAVKSLAVGDTLEADVRWTIHDAIAPGQFWFDEEFFDKGICLDEVMEFNVPANLVVKLAGSNPSPQVKEEGGRRIYSFRTSHLKKADEDDQADKIPDWEKDFHGIAPPPVRLSSFSSWAEVGAWYAGLQQPRVQVTPRIRSAAEEITKGKTTEDEKIRAIYDYVSSRFRYIGIDLGLGRYTPHAAEDVLSNRYGDCKDKHTLFAALLEAIGVHAYPALISSKLKIDPEVPSPSLFDHVITAIPRGDSYLFLDTTPEVAPFGLLLAGFRDRQVLVIPGDAPAKLIATPPNPPFLNREAFHMEGSIDLKGTFDGKVRLEDRGDPEILLRLAYRNTPQNQWKELTQLIFARMGFGGTVSQVVASQPEKTAEPFAVSLDYHRVDYSDWKESRITLPFPPTGLPELNEAQKKSKDPLPLGSPQDLLYETSMKLPEGVTAGLPGSVDQKNDFAEYTASYRFENGTIYGTRHLTTKVREVPGSERPAYSAFVKAIQDDSQKWIFILNKPAELTPLQQGLALLQQDKVADAVKVLEKAAEDEPENQQLALALGTAYVRLPDETKAASQFQKVLAGKPNAYALNSIAYSYANANMRLKEALDYASRAVAETSAATIKASPDSSDPADFLRMGALAAEWDTLGWAKFRSGDAAAAEKYLEAAWVLWQRAVVGEHLVEVYEKLRKGAEAQRIAHLALDAPGLKDEPDTGEKLDAILKPPALAKPGGKAATPLYGQAALSDIRTIHVPRTVKIGDKSKIALFAIALENGNSKALARFISGDQELASEAQALAAVNYHQPFPDSTPSRILRAGYVSCSKYTNDCTLILLLVDDRPSLESVKPQSK